MKLEQTVYLRLEPTYARWRKADGTRAVEGFNVAGVTKNPPQGSLPGVVLALEIRVPSAAFEPLRPVATLEVGMGDIVIQVGITPPPEPEAE